MLNNVVFENSASLTKITPIAIGCIGGSGSRVLCSILKEQNVNMGSCLNISRDNLWFTFLFKRLSVLFIDDKEFELLLHIFKSKMITGSIPSNHKPKIKEIYNHKLPLSQDEIDDSYHSLLNDTKIANQPWGWKEPNTHILASRINQFLPDFKYIYLQRNSLDMAFSTNQNQPKIWGKYFLGKVYDGTPDYSLKYWIKTHQRMMDLKSKMQDRMYIMHYDKLCKEPLKEIKKLNEFIGIESDANKLNKLVELIVPPVTIGRHKKQSLNQFDSEDLDYVRNLGHLD